MVPFLDELIFVSKSERSRMIAEGFVLPKYPSHIIYNGVAIKKIQSEINDLNIQDYKLKLGINPDAYVISFICRLSQDKNCLAFLDLVEYVKQKVPHYLLQFLVAGDGQQKDIFLQTLAERKLENDIKFLGFREDVPQLLASSDITVSVSRQEGFGLRIVEAMAVGTPCVTYSAGAIPELYAFDEGEALLAPVDDIKALGDKVIHLLDESLEKKEKLRNLLKDKATRFDIEEFVDAYESLYLKNS